MLFRYSFPMPFQDEIVPVIRYLESDHNPRKHELIRMFEIVLKDAESIAISKPENDPVWHKVKETYACLYALKHLHEPDIPMLPQANGCKMAVVQCSTESKNNIVRISIIEPMKLEENQ